jgi:hypothetical protein
VLLQLLSVLSRAPNYLTVRVRNDENVLH